MYVNFMCTDQQKADNITPGWIPGAPAADKCEMLLY